MAELNAVWSVVLQGFIGTSGLDGINPLLLAEHVTPKIMDIKARVFTAGAKRIAEGQKDQAVQGVIARLGGALANSQMNDSNNLASIFQLGGSEWAAAEGITRSEADKKVLDRMVTEAIIRKDDLAIARLKALPRAEDGSMSLGTLENSFPDVFDNALTRIKALNKQEADDRKAAQLASVENAVQAYEKTIINATPDEAEKAYNTTLQTLTEMSKAGLASADAALIAHGQKPKRRAGVAFEDSFVEQFNKNPARWSKSQVQKSIADGEFSPGILNRLKFPEDVAPGRIKEFTKITQDAAKAAIAAQLKGKGFTSTDLEGAEVVTRSAQLAFEMRTELLKLAAQKDNFSTEDANAHIEKMISRVLDPKTGDRRFIVSPTRATSPGRPVQFLDPLVNKTAGVNFSQTGKEADIDYSQIKPADLKGVTIKPRDRVMTNETLDTSTEIYKKTGSFPGEQRDAVQLTGLTQTEYIRAQSRQPRSLSDLAQGLQLAIKDNPRSTPVELFRANWQIQRQQELLQSSAVAPGSIAPETANLLQDLGKKEGGAKEYEAANSGKAGNMPNGIPGLTNMTIDQVLANPAHHVGKYQLQLGKGRTLDLLKQKMGLTGNEKFTPELQDRMASELIWGGWKRPALTAYLKGGGNLEKAVSDFNNEWEAGRLTFNAKPYLIKMRAAYVTRGGGAVGLTGNFRKENIAAVNWETKGRGDSYQKGGVDVYFNDKQFPAIAPGKVIDIGHQPGNKNSYGIYVITEHKDPKTGQTFQLINAHLDAVHVKIGDPIQVGTILGRQGSTGSTSAGGIASIDPLEPAPRGSKQTIPYRRPEVLKELLLPLLR
jgi:murein DD-endopeptidase MepM/ murein hydrolase activator NlpD